MDKDVHTVTDRDKAIELLTSHQVASAEFYNALRISSPMLSKLMMDKFKAFLNDTYFTDIERQTMLMKFFEEQTNNDVLQEVLTHIQECECKDDYTKLIMEWMYHNSDEIIRRNLAKVDGVGLCDYKQKKKLVKPAELTEDFIKGLIELTAQIDEPLDGDEE